MAKDKSTETAAVAEKEVTIQGVPVMVSQPYEAGHTITEAEAKALNQVRAENIGNNLRKTIKDLLDAAAGDVEAVKAEAQTKVAEKDAAYEFTLASVGGGRTASLSPLEKECKRLAREAINAKLREMGVTQKAYIEQNGEDALKVKMAELMEHPVIVESAKKVLEQRQNVEDISL